MRKLKSDVKMDDKKTKEFNLNDNNKSKQKKFYKIKNTSSGNTNNLHTKYYKSKNMTDKHKFLNSLKVPKGKIFML